MDHPSMMSPQEIAYRKTWRYRLPRVVRRYRHNAKHAAIIGFYKAINPLGLNRTMNRLICRTGRYTQYQPGVCGWCGKRHVDAERYYRKHPWARHTTKGDINAR